MLPRRFWVNHTLPSGAAAMSSGVASTGVGNSTRSWGPDALGVSFAMRSAKGSVTHTVPLGETVIPLPSAFKGVVLTTPTAGSISPTASDPVNHTLPSGATATSSTPGAGKNVNGSWPGAAKMLKRPTRLLNESANQMLVESAATPLSGSQNTSPQGETLPRTSPEVVIRRS